MVRWTLLRGQGRIRFEGTREDDVIRGRAEQNDIAGEFQLIRTAASKQRETAPYAATYRTDAGDLITVARFDFGDGVDRLALLDVRRGYWGTLMPTGRSEFLFAPARSGRFPVALRVAFGNDSDGRAMQVRWKVLTESASSLAASIYTIRVTSRSPMAQSRLPERRFDPAHLGPARPL